MFGRLLPREGKFFEFFNAHAACLVETSHVLVQLVTDLHQACKYNTTIQNNEKRADTLTNDTIDLLHKTFITPLDRDDIHKLISTMDDILDLIEDVSTAICLYEVEALPPEATQLAQLTVKCCECVQQGVGLLSNMKSASAILGFCKEIDRLESEADVALRAALSTLFREEEDVKMLIKLKAILELLEEVTDKCEDVADIIEGIVLENA